MTGRRWWVAIPASVMLVLSACSKSSTQTQSAPPPQSTQTPSTAAQQAVAVSLKQWSITPSVTTVTAGSVTFTVTNAGTIAHEFVVLSTDTAADAFPVASFEGEADRIDEDTAGTNVGETGDMDPAATKSITIALQPGHYALVCNLPGHYGLGMHIDFTVG